MFLFCLLVPTSSGFYSSLGRRVDYREPLVMAVGRVLDKGLELLQRAKSGEGQAAEALEGSDVLGEWESEIAMPRKKASSQWAGLLLIRTILMRAASFTWAAMYMIDVTALTRRVFHRRGGIGSAGIGRRARRCVLMGSWWLSVAMTMQF